jgi:hypothetical protein
MARRITQTIYYLDSTALLASGKKPAWWRQEKLTPLVAIDPLRFYGRPDVAPVPIPDLDSAIGGPWYAALWVTNNVGGTLMHPWDDDADWSVLLERLRRFRALAPPNLQGLLLDLEYYAGKDNAGNQLMDPTRAWPPHPRLRERADAFAAALSGWTLGGYVTATEIKRLAGLETWLRRMSKAGKTWCLAEDFNGARDPQAISDVGAHYVPGFHTVAEAREHGTAWVFDQSLSFLKKH